MLFEFWRQVKRGLHSQRFENIFLAIRRSLEKAIVAKDFKSTNILPNSVQILSPQ